MENIFNEPEGVYDKDRCIMNNKLFTNNKLTGRTSSNLYSMHIYPYSPLFPTIPNNPLL